MTSKKSSNIRIVHERKLQIPWRAVFMIMCLLSTNAAYSAEPGSQWQVGSEDSLQNTSDALPTDKDRQVGEADSGVPAVDVSNLEEQPTASNDAQIGINEADQEKAVNLSSETAMRSEADDDALNDALEAAKPKAPDRTAKITNRRLSQDIENQLFAINELLENEGPFHPDLGELYFSYASLLLQAAEFDEAHDAYANALHVTKVNHGIYSLEQRPVLRGLFETAFLQDEAKEFEGYLNRILWLERKHEIKDAFAFDLLIKVGNRYIDQYLKRPVAGEEGLLQLRKAGRYLSYAVQQYEGVPLNEKLMPYGELALVSILEASLVPKLDRLLKYDYRLSQLERRNSNFHDRTRLQSSAEASMSRGEHYLKKYLAKAQTEKSQEDIVRALLQLGDLNQIFQNSQTAKSYYQLASTAAENLPRDHELRLALMQPVKLPAFRYSQPREYVPTKRPTKLIPLTFSVNKNGRIGNILAMGEDSDYLEYNVSARRTAKKLTFRPAIIGGEPVDFEDFQYDVRIFVKRSQSEQETKQM